MCPKPSSSSSGSSTVSPTPVQSQPPKESPREGDPMKNKADCYGSGQKTEHVRIDNTINSFCNTLGKPGTILKENFFFTNTYTLPTLLPLTAHSRSGVREVLSLITQHGYSEKNAKVWSSQETYQPARCTSEESRKCEDIREQQAHPRGPSSPFIPVLHGQCCFVATLRYHRRYELHQSNCTAQAGYASHVYGFAIRKV